jgi:hypothetical protein
MKSIVVVIGIVLAFVSSAHAGERVGDAALGALSGAVVFGPVGLVAGAVVGYTAGPSIAQSWRNNRHHSRQRVHAAKRPAHVAARQERAHKAPPPGEVTPAPGAGGPPVQGLE